MRKVTVAEGQVLESKGEAEIDVRMGGSEGWGEGIGGVFGGGRRGKASRRKGGRAGAVRAPVVCTFRNMI